MLQPIKDRPVGITVKVNNPRSDLQRVFQLTIADGHSQCPRSQLGFCLFQTITPVPSSGFSKKAARIGPTKLGSSSEMAR